MPLFDLYPIETTSTIIEKKRPEWVSSTQTTSSLQKTTFYGNFISNNEIPYHQSFTRVSIDNDINRNFIELKSYGLGRDYDFFVPLPIKKSFRVKGQLKSVSKLYIIPSLD